MSGKVNGIISAMAPCIHCPASDCSQGWVWCLTAGKQGMHFKNEGNYHCNMHIRWEWDGIHKTNILHGNGMASTWPAMPPEHKRQKYFLSSAIAMKTWFCGGLPLRAASLLTACGHRHRAVPDAAQETVGNATACRTKDKGCAAGAKAGYQASVESQRLWFLQCTGGGGHGGRPVCSIPSRSRMGMVGLSSHMHCTPRGWKESDCGWASEPGELSPSSPPALIPQLFSWGHLHPKAKGSWRGQLQSSEDHHLPSVPKRIALMSVISTDFWTLVFTITSIKAHPYRWLLVWRAHVGPLQCDRNFRLCIWTEIPSPAPVPFSFPHAVKSLDFFQYLSLNGANFSKRQKTQKKGSKCSFGLSY